MITMTDILFQLAGLGILVGMAALVVWFIRHTVRNKRQLDEITKKLDEMKEKQ
ncbi:DUF4083 domain-containing protein [Bacillus sp. H-16]|uniref:DUF4083 domain-containing protein n=1 Tax=Alteribacter salitolerans TaxID=2912333 RepID=UPI00196600B2|nr:DUF4083 domain-containing protein [Alteribacter salitolerans]MBM7095262.1 DUF4083 domain-containing protein [Alteribacter salitolerans]